MYDMGIYLLYAKVDEAAEQLGRRRAERLHTAEALMRRATLDRQRAEALEAATLGAATQVLP